MAAAGHRDGAATAAGPLLGGIWRLNRSVSIDHSTAASQCDRFGRR